MLDEFFRTGRYRVRGGAEVQQTSSPSMDISKASNFERFVFDLVGRDAGSCRELWRRSTATAASICPGTAFCARIAAVRLRVRLEHATPTGSRPSARVYRDYGVMIDTHTADGLKVGLEHREAGRAAGVPGDRAAGEVRRDHPRSARARSRGAARLRGPGDACRSESRSSTPTSRR